MTDKTVLGEEFVDFDVESENWSTYELADKTTLRIKSVLMDVTTTSEQKKKLAIEAKLMIAVISPNKIKNENGKDWNVKELENFIANPNMMFRQIKDGGPGIYGGKDLKIIIHTILKRIDKTSKYNADGNPAYIVRTENQVQILKRGAQKNADISNETSGEVSHKEK